MDHETELRRQLVDLLTKGNAHMSFLDATAGFSVKDINKKAVNVDYTFWHLMEHIRRTQADILNFIVNSKYKELKWPNDYWPGKDEQATLKDFKKTVKGFLADNKKLCKLALSKKTDLYAKIAWGTGQNILKEILVVADHNAYHVGEFAILRQVLKAWPRNRKS